MKPFIPKQYKSEQITLRIDRDKLEKIDKIAAEYDLSRAKFINQCIDYALDNLMGMGMKNEEK